MADETPPRSPLADEAARLIGAMQDWTRHTFPPAPTGEPGTAAPVCQWCPLCQFMAVLRGDRPEVTERVTEAGSAIASALRALVDAASGTASGTGSGTASSGASDVASDSASGSHPRPPRVQRIDLGDGPDDRSGNR